MRFIPYVFRYERSSIASIRLPHSDTPGSSLACSFPRIFAACRVLLRLLAPRHSPYALTFFIILQKFFTTSTIPQSPFVTYCIVLFLGMHVFLCCCSCCCSTTHFVGKRLLLSNRFFATQMSIFVFSSIIDFLVGLTGLEPVTPRLSSACSNQLSYRPGLGLCLPKLVEARGLEPRTSSLQSWRSTN